MKNVMKRAWEIAKEGKAKFGGKVSEYLSVALKMAWAETKGSVKTVSWENDRGAEIEMTVEHITEEIIGYDEMFERNLVRKVDKMKITHLVIDGTEVSTWNTNRSYDKKMITTGLVEFRGQEVTIKIALPSHINEQVWGDYDKRQAKKEAAIRKIEKEQEHMEKVYNILECGA